MRGDQAEDTMPQEPQSRVPVEDSDIQAIRDSDTPPSDTERLLDDQVELSNGEETHLTFASRTSSGLQKQHRFSASHPSVEPAIEHIILCLWGAIGTGKQWVLPLKLCRTWDGLRNAIEKTFANRGNILEEVQAGKFDILVNDESVVVRDFWEDLVQSNMKIYLSLHSSRKLNPWDLQNDIEVEEGATLDTVANVTEKSTQEEPEYDSKVRHSVEYWHKDRYEPDEEFLYEKIFEDSVQIVDSGSVGPKIPILQEAIKVIQRTRRVYIPSNPAIPGSQQLSPTSLNRLVLEKGESIGAKELIIRSPYLLNALRAVVKCSATPPSGESDSLKEGRFPFPFRDLCYHKDDLQAYKVAHEARERHTAEYNIETDHHIDVLLDYLYSQQDVRLKEAEERWNRKYPSTMFASAWLLFKPGTDVYVPERGIWSAYVVDSISGGSLQSFSGRITTPYQIDVWNLAFDGTVITRQLRTIKVPVFDGEREISSLPVFPCRFIHEDSALPSMRTQLIQRGLNYVTLVQGPAYREYSGYGLEPGGEKYERARVVIDYNKDSLDGLPSSQSNDDQPYLPYPPPPRIPAPIVKLGMRARVPGCLCDACDAYNQKIGIYIPLTFSSYDDIDPKRGEGLTDHQLFLCSPQLDGYILKDRKYDKLEVKNIVEPLINIHAIDRLVMKTETNKSLIKAICEGYTPNIGDYKPYFADHIQGKGEGQILLLHGPPGTGKTLTAESVAEYTRRPLLSITAADLGHDPVELEKNLLTFFRNANNWRAIVLLDEADIYLERRSTNDLRRNSIVSIILRALDYFKGILFLTTNRVGAFDEAFMSRIHVQIGYDPLDEPARREIWSNHFQKLKENHEHGGREIRYDWDAKEYVQRSSEVRDLQWNGREIRNAFQTAVALAQDDAKGDTIPTLREAHFRKVVTMSQAFKQYMKSTHEDLDDSEMAYRSGLRDDTQRHPT